jgi:hypothetical protein
LPRQDRGVLQHAAEDQSALDDSRGRVGQSVEIDVLPWRIVFGNEVQAIVKTRSTTPRLISSVHSRLTTLRKALASGAHVGAPEYHA